MNTGEIEDVCNDCCYLPVTYLWPLSCSIPFTYTSAGRLWDTWPHLQKGLGVSKCIWAWSASPNSVPKEENALEMKQDVRTTSPTCRQRGKVDVSKEDLSHASVPVFVFCRAVFVCCGIPSRWCCWGGFSTCLHHTEVTSAGKDAPGYSVQMGALWGQKFARSRSWTIDLVYWQRWMKVDHRRSKRLYFVAFLVGWFLLCFLKGLCCCLFCLPAGFRASYTSGFRWNCLALPFDFV